jgi:transposase-like protein
MARGQRDPALERQWRERVAQWRSSGLSVREFCGRQGLLETSFYHWRRELRARDAFAHAKSSSQNTSRPKFVPVTVLPAAALTVEAAARRDTWCACRRARLRTSRLSSQR